MSESKNNVSNKLDLIEVKAKDLFSAIEDAEKMIGNNPTGNFLEGRISALKMSLDNNITNIILSIQGGSCEESNQKETHN